MGVEINAHKDFGERSLNNQMLQLMMRLDGKKDLERVVQGTNISRSEARDIVGKLLGLELVTRVENQVPCLPERFMAALVAELSQAMGPIAEVVLADELEDMSVTTLRVPVSLTAELINRLADQIPRAEKRTVFQRSMLEALKSSS